jgi:chitin synthase
MDFISFLVLIMTTINVGSYIIIALIHLPTHPSFVFKLLCDSLSYLGYQGAYSHVMVIYGFCNVDDVSWGTKGVKSSGKKKYAV